MILDVIRDKINDTKIIFNQNDSDPRNYKVSFKKVKSVLNFEPQFSVEMGINELINALNLGLFKDSVINKNNYGNFELNNKTIY